jgi:hypothetical protein
MKDLICILGVLFVVGTHESLTEIILSGEENANNERNNNGNRGPAPEFTFIQEKVGR